MKHRKKKPHHKVIKQLHKRIEHAQLKLAFEFPHVIEKFKDLDLSLQDLRRHSTKMLSAAALAGAVFVTSPTIQATIHPPGEERQLSPDDTIHKLKEGLSQLLPHSVTPLTPEIEDQIHALIKENMGINAVASLDGNHLNTTYGYMGAEQHLPRFPGDTIDQHDELQVKGITANRGAFGYFAPSREQLTQEDVLQEKYYVAVQTLYLPNWNKDHPTLKKWYDKRKVLVVNPANGKSVVAVIGDAGPAAWTGKHFGGSPEIMAELKLNHGKQKGAVLLFFVDEKDQHVALGPVEQSERMYIAKR
jgi:hypothetical protein